ncbi:MAG: murein biosynthesis integral membrane protein MurJ [Phycisphaerales bacterium]
MIKGFRQIAVLTALSRILGMLRDMAFAYFLGAGGMMDAWAIAFKIPNLARRLFGEGAAASSLIPVYSEQLHRDPHKAKGLALSVVTAVFLLLAAVTVLSEAGLWLYYHLAATHSGAQLKLALTGVMLPYMVLICVVAILGGILNTHRHFAAPAAAPLMLNVFLIAALCICGWGLGLGQRAQVLVASVAVVLAGLAQLAMQLPPLSKHGIALRPAWDFRSEPFRRVIFLMGPMILGLTATQISTLINDFTALWLSGSAEKGASFTLLGHVVRYPVWEGAVSHLFYAQRLYQLPLGVFGVSLATAIFPQMSIDAAKRDYDALRKSVAGGLRGAVFIALPATVGLLLVSRSLVTVILERGEFTPADTTKTAVTLSFYVLGLTGFFAQQVLTRAFYALQESRTPARTAVIAVCASVVLNLVLVWPLGSGGLAMATSICSYAQVVMLTLALRRRLGAGVLAGMGRALRDTAIATLAMATAVLGVGRLVDRPAGLIGLLLAVAAGTAAYLIAASGLRIEMLSLFLGRKERAPNPSADGTL